MPDTEDDQRCPDCGFLGCICFCFDDEEPEGERDSSEECGR
jgi:hypothetical protein